MGNAIANIRNGLGDSESAMRHVIYLFRTKYIYDERGCRMQPKTDFMGFTPLSCYTGSQPVLGILSNLKTGEHLNSSLYAMEVPATPFLSLNLNLPLDGQQLGSRLLWMNLWVISKGALTRL